jgi:hypothetical protein|nr:MAG TPA: hypothetical protein [Caudoviricetes sp.]
MNYKQLQNLFWDITNDITGKNLKMPNKFIRFKYPQDGMPDWKITDDIIFINLSELNNDYAKQLDSKYIAENDTVMRYSARTRVWNVLFTIYGPNAYDIANQIKDGVFKQNIHDLLSKNSVFLIPNLPMITQANELFAGKWWNRWDLVLNFNELYELTPDDVGRIENVSISLGINNR